MENTKQQVDGGSSSSSFTVDLFGPKDSSSNSSSTGLFDSVFGPPSTGLGRDLKKQDLGSPYSIAKHGAPANAPQRGKGESSGMPGKNTSSICQNETVQPCNYSSSIYYGGQEVYSPNNKTTTSQHIIKKDGGDDDPNGNSASRGNWWQGSLYY